MKRIFSVLALSLCYAVSNAQTPTVTDFSGRVEALSRSMHGLIYLAVKRPST